MVSLPQTVRKTSKGSEQVEAKRRIALIGDGYERPQQRACLAAVAEAFRSGAAIRGMASEFVLAVMAGTEEAEEYEATGLAMRGFAWEVLDHETAERALYYAGLTPLRPAGAPPMPKAARPCAVPDDGIRNLCDCDAWVFADPLAPAAFLPLRPFLVMIDDARHHALGRLSEESLRVVADNLTAAAGVLVWSDEMLQEVVGFYGVERQRVRQLPRPAACRCQQPLPGNPSAAGYDPLPLEEGRVWFVTEASFQPAVRQPTELAVLCQAEPPEPEEQISFAYGEALAELL